MTKVVLHTDGGARGNPGPAGSGAVVYDVEDNVLAETKKYLGHTTNNVAEYEAIRIGLEMIVRHFGRDEAKRVDVVVRMDSELACKQLNGEYRVKNEKLKPIFADIVTYAAVHFASVRYEHVRREKNKHADKLANGAMDEARNG